MAAKSPVVLILGAGPNIGQAVARHFASNGYKVALAARSVKEADNTDTQLNIPADFSKTEDTINAFEKTKQVFGIPSVVVYNGKPFSLKLTCDSPVIVSVAHFTPAEDPFVLPFEDFTSDTAVNIHGTFTAAQQAVRGFAQLPDSAARAFITTGNVLNVAILPKFMSQGVGKSAAAHLIWAASDAYKGCGYK